MPGRDPLDDDLDKYVRNDTERYGSSSSLASRFPALSALRTVSSKSFELMEGGLEAESALQYAIESTIEQARQRAPSDLLERLGGWHAETRGLSYPRRQEAVRDKYGLLEGTLRDWRPRWFAPFVHAIRRMELETQIRIREGDLAASDDALGGALSRSAALLLDEADNRLAAMPQGFPYIALTVMHIVPTEEPQPTPLGSELERWIQSNERLAVLFGPSGSGKSTAVLRFLPKLVGEVRKELVVFSLRQGSSGFTPENEPRQDDILGLLVGRLIPATVNREVGLRYVRQRLSSLVVVIDDFDRRLDSDRQQRSAPDLSDIADLLVEDSKVLLLTERTPNPSDPLTTQLQRPTTEPHAVPRRAWYLLPAEPLEIRQTLANAGPIHRSLEPTEQKLYDRLLASKVDALRRPIFLQLLHRQVMRAKERAEAVPLTLFSLMERYVGDTLSYDYDDGQSLIQAPAKRQILKAIAWEIFDNVRQMGHGAPLSVESDVVGLQVMERVTQAQTGVRLPRGSGYSEHNWVQDFLATNHLLFPTRSADHPGEQRMEFVKPAFYDFFLAESMLDRFANGRTLDLEDDFDERIVSSLVLYFMKQGAGDAVRQALRAIAVRPSISNADRLFMLFLLEDDEYLLATLNGAPSTYRTFLYQMQDSCRTVVARVVRYQVILLENSERRAFEFIEWTEHEQTVHREPEGELPAFVEPHEEFLLRRLDNPQLIAARPLTVFRLLQLGTAKSVARLQELAADRGASSELRRLAERAVEEIRERINEENKE